MNALHLAVILKKSEGYTLDPSLSAAENIVARCQFIRQPEQKAGRDLLDMCSRVEEHFRSIVEASDDSE